MKKTLLTFGAVLCVSASALAQGSVYFESERSTPGVAVEQWNYSAVTGIIYGTSAPGEWYEGSLTLQVYYAPVTTQSQNEIAAINSYEGSAAGNASSAVAVADLIADTDFTLEPIANASGVTGFTPGSTSATTVADGGAFVTTVDLPNVPVETSANWILVGTATIGGAAYEGLVGLENMSTGGNYTVSDPGTPEDDATAWNAAGINMNLAPVPEPTTLALVSLGGLSMLALRRRKA